MNSHRHDGSSCLLFYPFVAFHAASAYTVAMPCNPHIFRQYDIRGVAGEDLTPQVAELIGKGFGTFIQRRGYGRRVVVGRDVRLSSPELHKACVAGLRSTGCDIIDIGVALTPMMYFSLVFYGYDAGINITGSHNPTNENGFKLAVNPITSIYGDHIQDVREIIDAQDFKTGEGALKKKNIIDDYVAETALRVKLTKPPRIVIDCGNGTASLVAPRLYRRYGCDVTELFCDVDGSFPNHLPDPQDHENMHALRDKVLEIRADMGLAFDGDGDRVGMVDAKGNIYPGDILMIPLVRKTLSASPGASIIVDVKSTKSLIDEINKRGGKPVLGRTGPPYHKANMKKYHAPLAGEISGHYFITDNHWGFDDGLFAGGRILQALDKAGVPLHEYVADVPAMVSTPEIKFPCPDDKKFAVVDRVVAALRDEYECSLVDGVRMTVGDAWGLIRASNTTPNLTLRFEGTTTELRDNVKRIAMKTLEQAYEAEGIVWPI